MPRHRRPIAFWLEQIVAMSARLELHIQGMDARNFIKDDKTVDAVSWCISCIGEACGKILEIDPGFERESGIVGLNNTYAARNRYVHGYFDLDIEQIWDTASRSVPHLATSCQKALDEQT